MPNGTPFFLQPNVEVTDAARLHCTASLLTAWFGELDRNLLLGERDPTRVYQELLSQAHVGADTTRFPMSVPGFVRRA